MVRSVAERTVYLACRPIFTGQTALVRKLKKIRELVKQHRISLDALLAEYGEQQLVKTLKVLLDDNIFQSDSKAEREFPELFQSSPLRDLQRSESEVHAVQSIAEALEEIESLHHVEDTLEYENERPSSKELCRSVANSRSAMEVLDEADLLGPVDASLGENDGQCPNALFVAEETVPGNQGLFRTKAITNDDKVNYSVSPDNLPSLYPSYIPYTAQHTILTTAQRILEECCYSFFQRWKPSVLQTRGWECAQAVELTKWTRVLRMHSKTLPAHAFKLNDENSLDMILTSTHKLRHSAVHRLRITAHGVVQLIESARSLTEALQDTERTAQLDELCLDAESKVKAMELNKNVLEDEFAQKLEEIAQKRRDLDKEEEFLRAKLHAEDLENTLLIGSLLEESIEKIFKGSCESGCVNEGEEQSFGSGSVVEKLRGWKQYLELLARPTIGLVVPHVFRRA